MSRRSEPAIQFVMDNYIGIADRVPNRDIAVCRTLQITDQLDQEDTDMSLLLSGDIFLELAALYPGRQEKSNLITLARRNWDKVVRRNDKPEEMSPASASALFQLACELGQRSIILDGAIPDADSQQTIYENNVYTARAIHAAIQAQQATKPRQKKQSVGELGGTLGEIETLLLLSRFAIRELGGKDWFATPSYISEDFGDTGVLVESELVSWDISVLTQTNVNLPPELTYKVQVKAKGHTNHSGFTYSKDIDVINPLEDVLTKEERKNGLKALSRGVISAECYGELNHENPDAVTRVLDERTNELLDIIG